MSIDRASGHSPITGESTGHPTAGMLGAGALPFLLPEDSGLDAVPDVTEGIPTELAASLDGASPSPSIRNEAPGSVREEAAAGPLDRPSAAHDTEGEDGPGHGPDPAAMSASAAGGPWLAYLSWLAGRGGSETTSGASGDGSDVDTAPPSGSSPSDAASLSSALADAGTLLGQALLSFDGAGTSIIVIDSGWSPYYDNASMVSEFDFSGTDDASARVDTLHSHGAWVAQVVSDVAAGTDIIHLKVFPDDGGGASFTDIEQALDWAVAYGPSFNTVAVNLSLGAGNTTSELLTSLSDEMAQLDALGIFTVVAAGNAGATYPDGVNILAADPNAIGVSATGHDDRFAGFTQRHATLTDISALGDDVPLETGYGASFTVDGTSFSAPYVSGAAAVLQQAAMQAIGTRLTDEQFLEILQMSGRPVVNAGIDAPGYTVADSDAAVDYFLAQQQDYAPADALIA